MIPQDPNALLRRWISEGLNTERVSCTVLPEYEAETGDGFRPEDGPWIVLDVRGDTTHGEDVWIESSMQVRVWAGENQPDVARQRYGQVFDLIHDAHNIDRSPDGYILQCRQQSSQGLIDPDTNYSTVNSYFALRLQLRLS